MWCPAYALDRDSIALIVSRNFTNNLQYGQLAQWSTLWTTAQVCLVRIARQTDHFYLIVYALKFSNHLFDIKCSISGVVDART